jgi:flagella basal body P-ring formation protein FlgA
MKTCPFILTLAFCLAGPAWAQSSGSYLEGVISSRLERQIRIRRHLDEGANVDVTDLRLKRPELLETTEEVIKVEIPHGENGQGHVTARVYLKKADGAETSSWMSAQVQVQVPTLVARRPLAKGALLSASDLRTDMRRSRTRAVVDINQAIGQTLKRSLLDGDMLMEYWLTPPKVIHRGDRLVAKIRHGTLTVKANVEALQDGIAGQRVRLRIPSTGHILYGRVINRTEAEVIQ